MSVLLPFDALNNTRDLGGTSGADGKKIRPGKLLRSGHLYAASEADLARLRASVELVVDLRTAKEQEEKPDPAFGAALVRLPIYDSLAAGVTRDEASDEVAFDMVAHDPEGAAAYMVRTYRGFVRGPFARAQYARFLRLVLEPRDKAVLWHCTAGKDRAGFAAILIQEILGVDRAEIRADYLATNDCLAEECRFLVRFLGEKFGGLTPEIELALDRLFGAREAYFDALYETIAADYGDMDGFLRRGLGLTPAELGRLRALYLE